MINWKFLLGIFLFVILAVILVSLLYKTKKTKQISRNKENFNNNITIDNSNSVYNYEIPWTQNDSIVNTQIYLPKLNNYLEANPILPTSNYFINNSKKNYSDNSASNYNIIFNFLKNMPKGANLNIDHKSIVDLYWLLDYGNKGDGIAGKYNNYFCIIDTQVLYQSYPYNPTESILFQLTQVLPSSNSNWIPVTTSYLNSTYTASNDSSSSMSTSNTKTIRDLIYERITIYTKYLDIFTTYSALSILNSRFNSFFTVQNTFFRVSYYKSGLEAISNSNIQHLDIHLDFNIKLNDGNQTNLINNTLCNILCINNAFETLNSSSNLKSLKILLSIPRSLSISDMFTTIQSAYFLKNVTALNNFSVTFTPDQCLVASGFIEGIHISADTSPNINNPISFYSDIWVNDVPSLQKQFGDILEFYFDGSSANDNDWNTDSNIVDAFLLNSKRISNGYNIVSYPVIKSIILGEPLPSEGSASFEGSYSDFSASPSGSASASSSSSWLNYWNSNSKSNICFEISPIGDQMLQYYDDIGINYGATLYKQGIPVVLTANNPNMYGYSDITCDYFSVAISWGLSLKDLKILVFNSILYSSLSGTQLQKSLNILSNSWNAWINTQLPIPTLPPITTIQPSLQYNNSTIIKTVQIDNISRIKNLTINNLTSIDSSVASDIYNNIRYQLLNLNSSLSASNSQFLYPKEYAISNDLQELIDNFNNIYNNPKNPNNTDSRLPYANFFSLVENEYVNNIFNFLNDMPKGAFLNIYNTSIVDIDWLLGIIPDAQHIVNPYDNSASITPPPNTTSIPTYSGITKSWTGGKFYINSQLLSSIDPYDTSYGPLFVFSPSQPPSSNYIDATTPNYVKTNLQVIKDRLTFSGINELTKENKSQILNVLLSRWQVFFSTYVPSDFLQQSYLQGFLKLLQNDIQHIDIRLNFDISASGGNLLTLLNSTIISIENIINAIKNLNDLGYDLVSFKIILSAPKSITIDNMNQVLELAYIMKSLPYIQTTPAKPVFIPQLTFDLIYETLGNSSSTNNNNIIGYDINGFELLNSDGLLYEIIILLPYSITTLPNPPDQASGSYYSDIVFDITQLPLGGLLTEMSLSFSSSTSTITQPVNIKLCIYTKQDNNLCVQIPIPTSSMSYNGNSLVINPQIIVSDIMAIQLEVLSKKQISTTFKSLKLNTTVVTTSSSVNYNQIFDTSISQLQSQYDPEKLLKFYLDASIYNWDNSDITNVIKNVKRISNTAILNNYENIKQLLIQNDVCIEAAPIKDQIIGNYLDMRSNPSYSLYNQGLQAVLSTDLPSLYGYSGLTYDIMAASLAWGFNLQTIKNIVYNSVKYSSLSGVDLNNKMRELDLKWNNWINTQWAFKPCPITQPSYMYRLWKPYDYKPIPVPSNSTSNQKSALPGIISGITTSAIVILSYLWWNSRVSNLSGYQNIQMKNLDETNLDLNDAVEEGLDRVRKIQQAERAQFLAENPQFAETNIDVAAQTLPTNPITDVTNQAVPDIVETQIQSETTSIASYDDIFYPLPLPKPKLQILLEELESEQKYAAEELKFYGFNRAKTLNNIQNYKNLIRECTNTSLLLGTCEINIDAEAIDGASEEIGTTAIEEEAIASEEAAAIEADLAVAAGAGTATFADLILGVGTEVIITLVIAIIADIATSYSVVSHIIGLPNNGNTCGDNCQYPYPPPPNWGNAPLPIAPTTPPPIVTPLPILYKLNFAGPFYNTCTDKSQSICAPIYLGSTGFLGSINKIDITCNGLVVNTEWELSIHRKDIKLFSSKLQTSNSVTTNTLINIISTDRFYLTINSTTGSIQSIEINLYFNVQPQIIPAPTTPIPTTPMPTTPIPTTPIPTTPTPMPTTPIPTTTPVLPTTITNPIPSTQTGNGTIKLLTIPYNATVNSFNYSFVQGQIGFNYQLYITSSDYSLIKYKKTGTISGLSTYVYTQQVNISDSNLNVQIIPGDIMYIIVNASYGTLTISNQIISMYLTNPQSNNYMIEKGYWVSENAGQYTCPNAPGVNTSNPNYCSFNNPNDAKNYCNSDPTCTGYVVDPRTGMSQVSRLSPYINKTANGTYYQKNQITTTPIMTTPITTPMTTLPTNLPSFTFSNNNTYNSETTFMLGGNITNVIIRGITFVMTLPDNTIFLYTYKIIDKQNNILYSYNNTAETGNNGDIAGFNISDLNINSTNGSSIQIQINSLYGSDINFSNPTTTIFFTPSVPQTTAISNSSIIP